MSITYTFPKDFKMAELRGKTFTEGKLSRADGKFDGEPDAVDFGNVKIGGKNVRLKVQISGRHELEAALAAHKAEKAAIAERLASIGWPIYRSAQLKAMNARSAYDSASERGYPAKEAAAMVAADKELEEVSKKYPLAAAYAKAESYSMAHNYAKAAAGKRAMRAIEQGADPLQAVAEMGAEWTDAASRAVENSLDKAVIRQDNGD